MIYAVFIAIILAAAFVRAYVMGATPPDDLHGS
jgi:hypothetical protein